MNQLEIMSTASTMIGRAKIQSLDEGSQEADVLGQLWTIVTAVCLGAYDWDFNRDTVELGRELAAPSNPKWLYSFVLPSDYLSTIEVNNESSFPQHYQLENNRLLSNSPRIKLSYIKKVDCEAWSELFTDYVIFSLAARAAEPLNGEANTITRMAQGQQNAWTLATGRTAMGKGARPLYTARGSTWLKSRYTRGGVR